MKDLKNKFEKIYSKYLANKDHLGKVLNKWQTKGNLELYKSGDKLFQDLKKYAQEIKIILDKSELSSQDTVDAKSKIKLFKKTYKKLCDITKPLWRQWTEAIGIALLLVFVLRTYIFGLYHVPTGSAEKNILVGDRIWGNKMIYNFNDIKRGDLVIFDNPEFIYDKSSAINYWWQKYVGFGIPILGLPDGPDNWVKRVIGIPGDTIEGRIEDGKTVIYRNGKKLDETGYVNPYPLIAVKKETGLIDLDSFGSVGIFNVLRKMRKIIYYTYDPDKSFEDQSFYNIKEEEVLRDLYGRPILKPAYGPEMNGDRENSIDSFGPIVVPKGYYWVMGDSRRNSRDSRVWKWLDKDLIHGRASFVIYSVDSEEPFWVFELLKHPIDFFRKSFRYNRSFKWLKHKS